MRKCKNCKKELQLLRLEEFWREIRNNSFLLAELELLHLRTYFADDYIVVCKNCWEHIDVLDYYPLSNQPSIYYPDWSKVNIFIDFILEELIELPKKFPNWKYIISKTSIRAGRKGLTEIPERYKKRPNWENIISTMHLRIEVWEESFEWLMGCGCLIDCEMKYAILKNDENGNFFLDGGDNIKIQSFILDLNKEKLEFTMKKEGGGLYLRFQIDEVYETNHCICWLYNKIENKTIKVMPTTLDFSTFDKRHIEKKISFDGMGRLVGTQAYGVNLSGDQITWKGTTGSMFDFLDDEK